jgi:hypothetical protein
MIKKTALTKLFNLWPPYLGAGVRIVEITPDFRSIKVEMKLRFWNRNYVGTHFGGSLYAMADPFFMLILMENLGKNYVVWDKAATIRFKKPGRGRVHAHFIVSGAEIETIREQADHQEKVEPQFQVKIYDSVGDVVAEVDKLLFVRRKKAST